MMIKDKLTREQKRHLRKLSAIAYERDLSNAMENLFSFFNRWKAGEIDAHTLDNEIHKHHNGISRELYNLYTSNDPIVQVAHALRSGVINMEEVREDCWSLLKVFQDS